MMLYQGNCLDRMKVIQTRSVDMVLTDLPYGSTKCSWDSPIPLPDLWEQYCRITKKTSAIVLFAQTPFDKILGSSNLPMLRYEWIWEKTNATGHLNAKKMPMKAHENILVFYKNLPTYNPQKTKGHIRKVAVAERFRLQSDCYGKQSGVTVYDSTERYPRSVIKFSMDKQTLCLHPTQKPVALMEYLILTYTNKGDTVLDSCMGSGTTGVACHNTGRDFIGIELDEKYFRSSQERLGFVTS